MRTLLSRLLQVWFRLRYSYWFVPAIMMAASVVLAAVLIGLDRYRSDDWKEFGLLYGGGSDGARAVLSVIAGSMITVAGVVFSITIVALQLASSQFGPRVLRNFMRDRGNQIVLGTFVATFVYSLLVLRTIQGGDTEQVPAVAVTVAVVMAIASLAVLIYFIHHAAMSIQAPHILSAIGGEFIETVNRLYADRRESPTIRIDEVDGDSLLARLEDMDRRTVRLTRTGYIQAIDQALLVSMAREHDLTAELVSGPGTFVTPETPVVLIYPADRCDEDVLEDARDAFTLGSIRTHEQDVLFAADQLVEVALRSLSPGINDPFTAVSCVDWIGAGVIRLLGRTEPSRYVRDGEGTVRLLSDPVSLENVLEHTFGRLRPYAEGHRIVLRTMVDTLQIVHKNVRDRRQSEAVRHHLQLALEAADRSLELPEDMQVVQESAARAAERGAQYPGES